MNELLSELKQACERAPESSDGETIERGESIWLLGTPAHTEEGTIALGFGPDVRVVIREQDVRAVKKEGDRYSVEVGSDANVLVRIEKAVQAKPTPRCACQDNHERTTTQQTARERSVVDVEIGPITICDSLCADVVIDNGRQSVVVQVCIPVNCRTIPLQSPGG